MNVREWIENPEEREKQNIKVVYEDERTIAIFSPTPTVIGHILIFPKEHYKDVTEVPEEMLSHFFYVASFAATAVFEGLKAQGTNIIVNSGPESDNPYNHFFIQVLPRSEEDGIDFKWEPKKDQDLESIQSRISDKTFVIGKEEKPKSVEEVAPAQIEGPEDEENYLIKQLRRIP